MTARAIVLASIHRPVCSSGSAIRRLAATLLWSLAATIAWGQPQVDPVKPPDRSSPRAALKTFLDSTDAISAFVAQEYLPSPSRAKFNRLVEMSGVPVGSLDVSALPPAARRRVLVQP